MFGPGRRVCERHRWQNGSLGERGVDVHCLSDLFGCRAEFDSEDEFVDEFGTLFTEDICAK